MTLLGLWNLSIILAGVSLLIMAVLIVARLISERRAKKLLERRAHLLPRLLTGGIEDIQELTPQLGDAQTTDLLVDLISMVRGEEREQFVALASTVNAHHQLVLRLRKGSSRTKVSAAEALSHFSDDYSTNALDHALEDPSKDVRLTAALSLSQSGRAPPLELLIDRLSLGLTENSLLLVTLLQNMMTDRAAEIEALLEKSEIPDRVKAAAVEALAASGRFQVAPSINRLALETDVASEELGRFLRALGALRHPAGIPAVVKHLDAPTWWVRAAAAEAAGKIGIGDALPQLASLLHDDDWWVRFRAGEALARLGNAGTSKLRELSASQDERSSSAARMTLAELGLSQHV